MSGKARNKARRRTCRMCGHKSRGAIGAGGQQKDCPRCGHDMRRGDTAAPAFDYRSEGAK